MKVSNPDKPIFEEAGFTKADLVAHYESVGASMLQFCSGRPLTLQRFPNGISAKGFMQKNASDHFPATIGRFEVAKADGGITRYPVVTRVEDIAYLANQGTITFHMWLSTAVEAHNPDWMVMDLDPSPGDAAGARAATWITKGILDDFEISGFPVATGSSGFHIWIPLASGQTWADVGVVARGVAGLAAVRHPDVVTVEFLKKNRRGRVFADWLRNHPGATTVVPYSLRPRPEASIAMPLAWDELDSTEPGTWRLGMEHRRIDLGSHLPVTLPAARVEEMARREGVDLDAEFDRFGRSR
ncbi:MAG: non-homologous end-joining DNA ligase [Acidimicrobiia bacterium]|nr:non-homologous end-joining DNA ligase [Acidimicrobiia bacterium]MDH5292459.1 non-homologous end-joining DNA ligase [Acidimicrobiia bacterium]